MRILGLDPGTATTGYGIIDAADGRLTLVAYGVVSTPAGDPPAERLQSIFHQLRALLAEHRPDTAGVEQLFFGRNITTAIAVGQARGELGALIQSAAGMFFCASFGLVLLTLYRVRERTVRAVKTPGGNLAS